MLAVIGTASSAAATAPRAAQRRPREPSLQDGPIREPPKTAPRVKRKKIVHATFARILGEAQSFWTDGEH